MERRATQPKLGLADTYQIKHVGIEDVESATAVHEHLRKARISDDGVDDERVLPQVWNSGRMIIMIEGDNGVGPIKVGRRRRLGSVDLSVL
jgi:hypothetical protein